MIVLRSLKSLLILAVVFPLPVPCFADVELSFYCISEQESLEEPGLERAPDLLGNFYVQLSIGAQKISIVPETGVTNGFPAFRGFYEIASRDSEPSWNLVVQRQDFWHRSQTSKSLLDTVTDRLEVVS